MLDNSFQHSTTSIDTKKCSPAIETWQVAGLDITLATERKFSFDSYHEGRNIKVGTHDGTSPCDLLQGLVAGTSPIVCADL